VLVRGEFLFRFSLLGILHPLMNHDTNNDNRLAPAGMPSDAGIARRDFLRTAAFAGAALMIGASSNANAFWFLSSPSAGSDLMKELEIPTGWLERFGSSLPEYVKFLHRLRLKNIPVKAIIQPQLKVRGKIANVLPPKAAWKNMVPTLRAVDRLATVLDEPLVEVISAYRSPAYNRSCGSSGSSQHLRNSAVDLRFNSPPRVVSKVARDLREKGLFLGGVGRYSGFTHIDTRGRNADW
jgi:hypothetical protein